LDYAPRDLPAVPLYRRVLSTVLIAAGVLLAILGLMVDHEPARINVWTAAFGMRIGIRWLTLVRGPAMFSGKQDHNLINEIRQILLNDWNPIEFPVPDDGYDSYIPYIFRLLTSDADHYKVTEHLLTLETTNMGLSGNRPKCSSVAEKLLQLRRRV